MVLFWWWEFRLAELRDEWTVGVYFFLVLYSVTLFLVAVVLIPRDWDGVTDLRDFFMQRRVWFYSLLLCVTGLDMIDAYLKGGMDYIGGLGWIAWGYWAITLPVAWVGMRSLSHRFHTVAGVTFFVIQVVVGFEVLPTLTF